MGWQKITPAIHIYVAHDACQAIIVQWRQTFRVTLHDGRVETLRSLAAAKDWAERNLEIEKKP
jgi:hypothetical protein